MFRFLTILPDLDLANLYLLSDEALWYSETDD